MNRTAFLKALKKNGLYFGHRFLGFLDGYPEYWTQGRELEEMLADIFKNEQEVNGFNYIPG